MDNIEHRRQPQRPKLCRRMGVVLPTVDCYNNPGPARWVIQLFGSVNFVWAEAPVGAGTPKCPPTGPYTVTCNSCTGGTGASLVLS